MRHVKHTKTFKKQYKQSQKRGYKMNLLQEIMSQIARGESLPPAAREHHLSGNYAGHRECHIKGDWLLIYRIEDPAGQTIPIGMEQDPETETVIFELTGTHSDLF